MTHGQVVNGISGQCTATLKVAGAKKSTPARHGRCIFLVTSVVSLAVIFAIIKRAEMPKVALPQFLARPALVSSQGSLDHSQSGGKINGSQLDLELLKELVQVNVSLLPPLPELPGNLEHLFRGQLAPKDLETISETLWKFQTIMAQAKLTYFIYKGSLLGSYRHHNMIPWDDDVDVLVSLKDKRSLKSAFSRLVRAGYKLDTSTMRYKFYSTSANPIKKIAWRAPFVDVSFYRENATHLWDITIPKQAPFSKSHVFPLTRRPLMGHLYPSPRDPRPVLQLTYSLDVCHTGFYNHTSERVKKKSEIGQVACAALIHTVPFVQHVRGPGGAWCKEVLTLGDSVVNTFVRSAIDIPVC